MINQDIKEKKGKSILWSGDNVIKKILYFDDFKASSFEIPFDDNSQNIFD